jgi:hypothetical protein
MCSVSIVSFYYLSSSLSSGLGTHCSTFLSRIHPLSMPWERSCDGFGLKVALYRCSVSMVSFYYVSVSVISANSSSRSIHFQRSVSVVPQFPRSVSASQFPCFQFYRSRIYSILQRSRPTFSRFRYPVVFISSTSYTTSLFHLVSLTRHLYNMSPIVTFLVSGLLFLFRRCVALILGFLAMSPVPFVASCFSVRRRTSWLLPPRGFEDPRKTSPPSRRYDDIASRLWV